MKNEDWSRELLHLEAIKEKLEAELQEEKLALEGQKQELVKKRRQMWEECPHGVWDFDDIVNMNAYDENVREEYGHYTRKEEVVRQLSYLSRVPYFGRIDFREAGEPETEEIYIGRYGFRNKKTHDYEIYDWRTPIASMFYDCSMGEASYHCPAGEIHGELTRKRQYKMEDGVLKYWYDTDMAVQDDFLGEVLSENTDKVLRVIIDTITREQNQAIRQSQAGDLLITGPAGSGKTSVGMHRLAYLLYHNRNTLTSEKIVVMSRNQIFSSYISGILPELGEESVNNVMFDDLVLRGIPGTYRKKGYYEQAEYLIKHKEDTIRKQGIRLKYSREFLNFLKESLKIYANSKTDFSAATELYLELLKQYTFPEEKNVFYHTRTSIRRSILYYEDILVISYIRLQIGGIRPMSEISHLVIDEAQDYSRLQLMILKEIYPKSRFTILADRNQAVDELLSTVEAETIEEIFGKGIRRLQLTKSYRSTAPINQFAFGILGIDNRDLYMERDGKAPEFIQSRDWKETMEELLKQIAENKSVGILTCDVDSARRVKQELGSWMSASKRRLQYIFRPDASLEEKTVVMPILLAKGLEFDVVIVWDDKTPDYWEEHKNLKYLMCTRALHELYFVSRKFEVTL